MPDPMTKMEIEDVLASIRRLVSEDAKPVRGKPEKAAGRLVLTPALRVEDGRSAAAAEPVATLHRATAGMAAPQASEAAARFEAPRPAATAARTGSVDASRDGGAVPAEGAASAPADDARTALKLTIAELEAAVAARSEDWEPDGTEAAEPPTDISAPLADVFRPRERARERPLHLKPEVYAPRAAAPDSETDEKPAEQIQPDWTQTAKQAETPAPPVAGGLDEDDVYLDEDALRELVRDIIRQELQGALGERITRNVRKLVRAEVNRALASRNFE